MRSLYLRSLLLLVIALVALVETLVARAPATGSAPAGAVGAMHRQA